MTVKELVALAENNLPFELTERQTILLNALSLYVLNHKDKEVFVLNGYAGTGKTTVVGALVKALKECKINTVVLAPTGRAAKVAANLSDGRAFTIHKRIFRGNSLDPSNRQFFLAENRDKDTIFIIDEASLIADSNNYYQSLLQQLIRHIFSAPGCGLIFLGDTAQLSPIGMTESAAMSSKRLYELGLTPFTYTLDEPLRQAAKSGILYNATFIRRALLTERPLKSFGLIKKHFADVEILSSEFLADNLSDSWSAVGQEETLLITRSNKRANLYNNEIRNRIMYAESPLERGERLIISKNDYYWSKKNKLPYFLANGESIEITWIGKPEKVYGRWFVDIEFVTSEHEEPIEGKIMMRSLSTEGPSIPREEMQRFYNIVMESYAGETSYKIKGALEDPYYNALQVKYAYCVTCHKAQGGQWKHVYVDLSGLIIEPDTVNEFYRWLYTAVTRATEKVFFVNPDLKIAY